jgi:hypothetical protein
MMRSALELLVSPAAVAAFATLSLLWEARRG